ncbi:MAG: hypothetical protein K8T10_19215, partial [Candidatus Eremiobacteraeota bacterium]|nr:hypothetical protein [Candidatus Eremiobacteraeota bacterium]
EVRGQRSEVRGQRSEVRGRICRRDVLVPIKTSIFHGDMKLSATGMIKVPYIFFVNSVASW